MPERLDPATLCVHAPGRRQPAELGLNTPVVNSTAFDYTEDGLVRYPRYYNLLNHEVVAGKLAALEGAEAALVTASGMGAISAVMLSLLRPGDHAVLLEGLYGGTSDLVDGLMRELGVAFSSWDGRPDSLKALLGPRTRLVMVESPTNPLLNVIDLRATAAVLGERGVIGVIDNTFATPILQRPLELGFDLAIHSGTKYLGGHSDLLCGAVAGRRELIDRIRPQAIRLGAALGGRELALLERSLKTLSLRVERQSCNALALAGWLSGRQGVEAVHYPGLAGHPGHPVARAQMSAFGGMLSFRLTPALGPNAFLARLGLIRPAVSLGGVETTVCQPSRTSHARLPPDERGRLGIDDLLMRLSVGIEGVEDLKADLDQALAGDGDLTLRKS